jgi:hypothetical protein
VCGGGERDRRREREGGRERGERHLIEASAYMGDGRCDAGGGGLGVREMRKGEGDAERRERRERKERKEREKGEKGERERRE